MTTTATHKWSIKVENARWELGYRFSLFNKKGNLIAKQGGFARPVDAANSAMKVIPHGVIVDFINY